MGIFTKNEKSQGELAKPIPKDKLAFYCSGLKKKEGYTTYVVSFMPFSLDEIDNLSGDKVWERLTDLSVAYLRDVKKELPSFAKEQDYERSGGASYQTINGLVNQADRLDFLSSFIEPEPIKVFNNAFDKIIRGLSPYVK